MAGKEFQESLDDLEEDIKQFVEHRLKQFYMEQYLPISNLTIHITNLLCIDCAHHASRMPQVVRLDIDCEETE